MPDAGGGGWYSDWSNRGAGGQPAWETFHTQELPQLLERNWGASANRASLPVCSMGGFGALSYAARHPGFFKAAASYSGVADTVGSDFSADPLLWGDKIDDRETWEAHNPVSLAESLADTPVYVSYGDGDRGPLDTPGTEGDGLERWLAVQNERFVKRLEELGYPRHGGRLRGRHARLAVLGARAARLTPSAAGCACGVRRGQHQGDRNVSRRSCMGLGAWQARVGARQ